MPCSMRPRTSSAAEERKVGGRLPRVRRTHAIHPQGQRAILVRDCVATCVWLRTPVRRHSLPSSSMVLPAPLKSHLNLASGRPDTSCATS